MFSKCQSSFIRLNWYNELILTFYYVDYTQPLLWLACESMYKYMYIYINIKL